MKSPKSPKSSSLAILSTLLAACAGAPPVSHPEVEINLPERWTAEPSDTMTEGTMTDTVTAEPPSVAENASWWLAFGDSRLDAVIADALSRNYDLEAASARVFSAAALSRIDGADALPQIDGGFDGSRSQRNFIGFPIPGTSGDVLTTRATTLGLSLDLQWELDVWGRIRAGHSAAIADVEAARADVHGARLSLTGLTAKLWFAVVETRRQRDLAVETLANFRSTHNRVVSRYERGLRSSLDVRFSLTNIAAAEASLANRDEQLDRLTREIEVLAGRYPAAAIEISSALPELSTPVPAGLPSELIHRRPDIAAAERRLAAAGARVKQARRALYPRFSFTTSVGTNSKELTDLVDRDFSIWTLAGNLAQPFFQGGRLVAGIDLARSEEREVAAFYAGTVLNAFREVEAALAAEDHIEIRERALREAAVQSVAARQLAEERYDRGLDDIITVLEAQRRAFQSESELLAVQRERLENRVDLHLALGGDFPDLQPSISELSARTPADPEKNINR